MSLEPIDQHGHLALEDRWSLLHRHALGRAGEAFARGLERGALVASRCPGCGRTLLPPRAFCERCFRETELVEHAARTGRLESFTIVRHGFAGSPPVPYAIGYGRLDGVDTCFGALADGFDPGQDDGGLAIDQPVELVIAAEGFGMERVRWRPGR